MDKEFSDSELLVRAVYFPSKRPEFWKNGKLSSAALKDKKGLSVDRTGDEDIETIIEFMRDKKLKGIACSWYVSTCKKQNACLKYLPSKEDIYHSEIWGSESKPLLSDSQARELARSIQIAGQLNPDK